MRLYSYWRSTTSYRVRIALNLKGIDYEICPVDLVAEEHLASDYAALNPGRAVPTLITMAGAALPQSMAILEWLEEVYPDPALLPGDPAGRARIRAAAMTIAADIHPVNNLRVIKSLRALGHGQDQVETWMRSWMAEGLAAFAAMIEPDTAFCFGDRPTLADLCLVPQLYNAHRWGLSLSAYPRLREIELRCLSLPAFRTASPEEQPDAR